MYHDLSKRRLKSLFVLAIFDKELIGGERYLKRAWYFSKPTEVTLDNLFYFINTITQNLHEKY